MITVRGTKGAVGFILMPWETKQTKKGKYSHSDRTTYVSGD